MGFLDIYDRMKVDIPLGEIEGMKVDRFEVVYPDQWTKEHEKRKDVCSPLQLARMQMEGVAPRAGWYTRISEDGSVWMSDTTFERRTHAEPVFAMSTLKPKRVVINGLGIGMVLSAALSFDYIEHIDVVEIDERVLELVGPHYEKDSRVHLHHADAEHQMKEWPSSARWDVGWTDIWPEINADNLAQMKKFSDFYDARCDFHGNWGEGHAKRYVWDNRHWEKTYLKFLTEEDKEQFEDDDEQAEQELWEDEEDDDDD